MIGLDIRDETAPLEAVVLGTAESSGGVPKLHEAYDPKSIEHINAGTYPKEQDMIREMDAFCKVFEKYGVKVYRPEVLKDCNQIFTRDIAFVVDDYLIKSNILPKREKELEAIDYVVRQVNPDKVVRLQEDVHIEGGDVMLWGDYIFVGTYRGADYPDFITARTNEAGVRFLESFFPQKKVIAFNLRKSNTNAKDNALHLDCCFQPVGRGNAIIHREGFLEESEYQFLVELFGEQNLFHIDKEEMYFMNSNVFSISPDVVVSERGFTRLNQWLRAQGMTVEEIPYAEIAKQEGLLRCSTLPLKRTYA
ncbi:dimethylarginine dimethylaminohydrolase family protein [Marinoscillum sp. MHG1-6]|uniref:dimethylarginine dimethylaminohydrolase family protein n=1 Tax=Marinoscillum sp. MHG1-6 TaxID=2959627 RepID=UPI002157EDF1|nr:arginine deiminase family protein [Marinoscillum sp. MHG1-6]